jgi:site-specific recombinase XerD
MTSGRGRESPVARAGKVLLAMSSLAPNRPNAVVVRRDHAGYRLEASPPESVAVANEFLASLSIRGLSPATVRAYAFDLVVLYRWLPHANLVIEQLSSTDVLRFIEHQQRAGARPKSINHRLVTCEQLYRFITGDSMSHARLGGAPYYAGRGRGALGLHQRKRVARRKLRVKEPQQVVEPLTVDQVAALLRRLRRYRDVAIVHLMLLCGLRSMEVLSLRLNDLVLDDKRLRVRGKGNRERDLPLADFIADLISDYLRVERPPEAATEHLFVILQGPRRGRPMTSAGLRSLFRHRRRTSGELVHANPHRLRHTFGADMARAGVRLPMLQRLMGHADGKTTLQYIRLSMADVAFEYARAMTAIAKRYSEKA